MICEELMKHTVESVAPTERVESAARRMRDLNIGFLPVVDPSGRAIGTLTDRDIAIRHVAEELPRGTEVGDLMTHEVVACRPEDDIREAEALMARKHKSRVLCVDEHGRPLGVISLSDIAQCESDERAAWTLRQVAEREGPVIHYGF
jgi:CBS domain-containing protein